ncbi:MAG: T9SS type A sorting domain-containing protein [Candidatus Marinimicrobia bacterium]|nr:T9SS type A sorting domain-containing protein [Candidatus Neomarinimicrobiota bacterium]
MGGPYTSYGGGIFVDFGTCNGKNNIVYNNTALNGANCYGNIMFSYSCSSPALTGVGNIGTNPMFVNPNSNFYLQAESPCIDTGDPNSPLDPDSTRADMGCYYYDESMIPEISVTLTPVGMPIQIPANGGTFEFNIAIANDGTAPETFDIWTMITLPNGSQYGPLINFPNFTAPANWSGNRDRDQVVPVSAPSGNYVYNAYVGEYPDVITASDEFAFSKSAVDEGNGFAANWDSYGESFHDIFGSLKENLPVSPLLLSVNPNPFNPETDIAFSLGEAGNISLVIYDVSGREIVKLAEGYYDSGSYKICFNAEGKSSGIYFAVLKTSYGVKTTKLLVVK